MHGVAFEWLAHARALDAAGVWARLDADFRLGYAQNWILANSPRIMADPSVRGMTRDEFASAMAQPAPSHPLWPNLARALRREVCQGRVIDSFGDRQMGVGTNPRPVAPGLELVRLIPLDVMRRDDEGNYVWPDATWVEALTLTMRLTDDGWSVAGLDHQLLVPGWPPEWRELGSPSD